jgi:hypothetical protein
MDYHSGVEIISINILKRMDELQYFYQKEKQELGIETGEETDFLATHETWRGHPRTHICQERVKDLPDVVLQSILHHEISHAFHHGTLEAAQVLRIDPNFSLSRHSEALTYKNQADTARVIEALRKAGLM